MFIRVPIIFASNIPLWSLGWPFWLRVRFAVLFYLKVAIIFSCVETFAWLITYFGNFIFGFLSLRLHDYLYDVFRLQGKMGKTKRKINKLLHNILVTLTPKTIKNEVTKMGWNAHLWHNSELNFGLLNEFERKALLGCRRMKIEVLDAISNC